MISFRQGQGLYFPAGVAPGFDPTHPASYGMSRGHGFSCVAMPGGAFFDILKPARPTVTGTITAGMDGGIGSTINCASSVNNSYQFAGYQAVSDPQTTVACIINPTTLTTPAFGLLNNSSGASGVTFFLDTGASLRIFVTGATGTQAADSTIVLPTANTPYFVAASCIYTSTIIYLIKNLRTGVVRTQSTTMALTVVPASNGTMSIPASSSLSTSFVGGMAAAMYSPTFLPLPQLLQWANDPWAFWYPQADENWVGALTGFTPYNYWQQNAPIVAQ